MVVNPTPTFMRLCIEAWRKDWALYAAVIRTVQKVYGDADEMESVKALCGRPKTPESSYRLKGSARVWLARHFRPVSDALFDGATDEEAYKIWIRTDRKNEDGLGKDYKALFKEMGRTRYIKARALSGEHGSFFKAKK